MRTTLVTILDVLLIVAAILYFSGCTDSGAYRSPQKGGPASKEQLQRLDMATTTTLDRGVSFNRPVEITNYPHWSFDGRQ